MEEIINKRDICGTKLVQDLFGYHKVTFDRYLGFFGVDGNRKTDEKDMELCNNCNYNLEEGIKKGFCDNLKLQAELTDVKRELSKAENKLDEIKSIIKK
jgi:hypothetical protein